MKRVVVDRRQLLRGAGSIAIALPVIEAMGDPLIHLRDHVHPLTNSMSWLRQLPHSHVRASYPATTG